MEYKYGKILMYVSYVAMVLSLGYLMVAGLIVLFVGQATLNKMAEGAVFEMFVFVVSTLGVIIYNTIITK